MLNIVKLYELFAESRRKAQKYTSKEIDQDINRALKAVRVGGRRQRPALFGKV